MPDPTRIITTGAKPITRRTGGRPTAEQAARLPDTIRQAATTLLLARGFADTSMEAIATAAGVSKRTLYARFPDKQAVLRAVLAELVGVNLPGFEAALANPDLPQALIAAGHRMLEVSLSPTGLGLYRLLVAEAGRIPDLPRLLHEAGAGEGIAQVAARLARTGIEDAAWRAEQFQRLIVGGPQSRALGFGPPLTADQRDDWVHRVVKLILADTE